MNYDAINDFLSRVKRLSHQGSKDMRLSFQEANILAITIGELLVEAQRQTPTSTAAPTVIDGGTFTDRNAKPK